MMNLPLLPPDEQLTLLDRWYNEGNYAAILRAIEALPAEARTLALACRYATALTESRRFAEALDVLLTAAPQGHNDAMLNYELGNALYLADRHEEALPYLKRAIALGEYDKFTLQIAAEIEAVFEVDFNEVFHNQNGDVVVLLSQTHEKQDKNGHWISFYEGMPVNLFEPNEEDGHPDNLIAHGVVTTCTAVHMPHVKWCCKLDEHGIRHESDLHNKDHNR